MASVFVVLRLSGQVTNGEARDLVARLTDLTSACDAVWLDVKQSVDVRLDAEPDPEPEPDVDAPAEYVATTDDVPEPEHEDPV